MSAMYKFDMYADLYEAESRLQNAHRQVYALNARLADLEARYGKALQSGNRVYRYRLRMKIITIEGLMNAYYEYTLLKKEEIKDLRFKLFGEEDELEDEDEEDEEGEEEETEVEA